MTITERSRKALWARSGDTCAFQGCDVPLVQEDALGNFSVVGVEAHIIGDSPTGPRGVASLSEGAKSRFVLLLSDPDGYPNRILLCPVHHKLVDDHEESYTIDALVKMKADHEAQVRGNPGFDAAKVGDDEAYAEYVDRWAELGHLDNWDDVTFRLLGPQPNLTAEYDRDFGELNIWLLARKWPGRYPTLEYAFQNFRLVLNDLSQTFNELAEERFDGQELWTRKIYQIDTWDPERYDRLAKAFSFHVALVQDLTLELVRAANEVCNQARAHLDPSYRLSEGVLLAFSGPYLDGTVHHERIEYAEGELEQHPYRGVEDFKRTRKLRHPHMGEGTSIDDQEFAVGDDW